MREIVLDTETTGFEPAEGHRMVEIGCVELVNHLPTGRVYHQYINPKREMPIEAFNVHGLSNEFLANYPPFEEIVDEFLEFIGSDPLVIHNASFDVRFLNAELKWANRPELPMSRAVDTLTMARRKFPGSPASLDALCRRFGVDNSAREKHGALLDSEILAEVYLELLGGRQKGLELSVSGAGRAATVETEGSGPAARRPSPLPERITEEERRAHEAFIAELGEGAVWSRFA